MKKLFSGIYEFETVSNIFDVFGLRAERMKTTEKAVCRLRILQDKTKTIVIATELDTNPGMSITNSAEVLAEKVVKEFSLDPKTTVFIEHYGEESEPYDSDRKARDSFDEVTFVWEGTKPVNPKWKRVDDVKILKDMGIL